MAFDPALHTIDPATGFMIDRRLGHRVGLEQAPVFSEATEYPKWVDVHPSHLDGGVAQEFGQTFRNRDGAYTVLVKNAEDEARAKAEAEHPTDEAERQPELEQKPVNPHAEPQAIDAGPVTEPAPMPELETIEPAPGFDYMAKQNEHHEG
jgi:hypothetical protein